MNTLVKSVVVILLLSSLAYFVLTYSDSEDEANQTIFEGMLNAPCGGVGDGYFCQATPSISYKNNNCAMNLLLKTENSNGSLWYDNGNIRTSFCFFESKFDEKEFKSKYLDKSVIIRGTIKNATVCVMKCSKPKCPDCSESEILIPTEITIK